MYAVTTGKSTIYFKDVLLEKNLSRDGHGHQTAFKSVLVHELIHIRQFRKYGYIGMRFHAPIWVIEGYATYATRKTMSILPSSITQKSYLEVFGQKEIPPTYLLFARMVQYAIEKMHVSVDDLHRGKVDYDRVLDLLLKEYNIARYKQPEEPSSE